MSSRTLSTAARAERDGVVVCPDVLVVVEGRPAGLGTVARDDITAWFYGALERQLAEDLEDLAAAAQSGQSVPEVTVDLVLQTPGSALRLEGCQVGLPVRHAGPASTLQYRVAHPGVEADAQLELPIVEPPTGSGLALQQTGLRCGNARPDPVVREVAVEQLNETIDSVLDRLGGELRPEPVPAPQPAPKPVPMARPPLLKRLRHLRLVTHEPPSRAA